MKRPTSVPALDGLAIEAVEWLPSGSDAGLMRVRARWSDTGRREHELPALVVRRGEEARRFESLPDARFGREPALWRTTYLVPSALMEPAPDELLLSWESGAATVLPAPERGFEPPHAPPPAVPEPDEEPGGEVIDRAVLAERRSRRAEAAEQAQAERAAQALKAVEVLELRSAELERRLEALQAEGAPAAGQSPAPVASVGAPAPTADLPDEGPRAEQLTAAVAAVKRLRGELVKQRRQLRRSELLRAADAVALASLREQEGRIRLLEQQYSASQAELARARGAAEAAAAEAATARGQAAEQVALARQRAAGDAAAVRARAADELAAISEELTRVRSALASVRSHASERAAGLERRLAELETALAAERRTHAGAVTKLEAARAVIVTAEATNSAESLARAALEEELDRERSARATLSAALVTVRSELARVRAELAEARPLRAKLVLVREQARAEAAAVAAELKAARERGARADAELTAVSTQLAAARVRIAELERVARSHVTGPAHAAYGLLGRVSATSAASMVSAESPASTGTVSTAAPVAPAASIPPVARAAPTPTEPSAPAVAEPVPRDGDQRQFSAKLDAAAAALRARSPREPATVPAAASRARSQREYPWLRAALVKLAHEDPQTAARLMLGLVPAQSALLSAPLEYDLTIRGSGSYAISVDRERATAGVLREPRSRDLAAFHMSADVVTLAELLAGVQKRMGRWIGSVRLHGPRREAETLRDALVGARLDLGAAARAGADLDPDLVWRALAHAIHPSWTLGHNFTIAQEITGPRPRRWQIAVRDGAPVVIERTTPGRPPDAVVAMSRATFSHLLRGGSAPGGARPAVRGDRAAVATLKAWTDRAQGRAG